jgi:CheY-like chemotaxis protein/HPt (histidine-containing phosphotransfer) domain-containing protein
MAFGKVDRADSSNLPHLKILVVDDDELNRRMMQILLTREGHHVDLVANGMDALDAVKYHKFDIVFMDLQMPIMDGVEASRRIRQWENGGSHTFIVALTASYLPEEGQLLFEAGIDNYIAKPFEVDHIQRLLTYISKTTEAILVQPISLPSNTSTIHDVLDIQKGTQRVGGEPKIYKELLSDFVQGLPKRVEILDRYALERDLKALSREAHNLKGVSSNLGALELAECAAKLDKQCNASYTDAVQVVLLELKQAETNLRNTATAFLVKEETTIVQS